MRGEILHPPVAIPIISAAPAPPASAAASQRHRRRSIALAAGLAGLAVVIAVWAFRQAGTWLVVQDPLLTVDAIVVLSGGMPYRAREAAKLYEKNFAAQVWVSQPLSPRAELGKLGIPYVDESFYSQKILIALGVPADAIRVFQTPAANTQDEVAEIARECRQDKARKVIIVTSKAHTRRVRFIWHRVVGNNPEAVVRYATEDSFESAHWWRSTGDVLEVVREFLGLANAGLGFPLRPESH